MPITEQQAEMLAELAHVIRADLIATSAPAAKTWDQAGVKANIGKVKHLSLADVTLAVARAADDPDLNTPGAIGNARSSCYRERQVDRTAAAPARIAPAERCSACGAPLDGHWAADGHAPEVLARRGAAGAARGLSVARAALACPAIRDPQADCTCDDYHHANAAQTAALKEASHG